MYSWAGFISFRKYSKYITLTILYSGAFYNWTNFIKADNVINRFFLYLGLHYQKPVGYIYYIQNTFWREILIIFVFMSLMYFFEGGKKEIT